MGLAHSTQLNQLRKGKREELALSHKKLDHICKKMYVPNTKKWFFSNNYISHIHPRVCFLHQLTVVDLSSNEISVFPLELCDVVSLKSLNLSFNFITSLPPQLNKLKYLCELRLSFNLIRELPQDVFEDGLSIERLELNNNFLEHLPTSMTKLSHLKHLNLQNNDLSAFPDALYLLALLEELNLSHNSIQEVHPVVGTFASLRILQLHNNELISFPPTDLYPPHLPNLTHLRLNNNKLRILSPCISRITTLQVLNLRNNVLLKLPSAELRLLTNMKRLNISLNYNITLKDLSMSHLVAPRSASTSPRATSVALPPPPSVPYTSPRRNKRRSKKLQDSKNKTRTDNGSDNKDDVHHSPILAGGDRSSGPEIIVSRLMVPTLEQVKAAGTPAVYCNLRVVEEVYVTDNAIFEQHVEHLFQQSVWSGGYESSIEDQIRETLRAITKVRDGLYLSSKYGAQDREALHKLGVTHILTVASELSPYFPDEFDYCVINVRDNSYSNDLTVHFPTCHKFIDIGRKKGGVLVHCSAGVSRSATVVMSYLMRSERISFSNARKEVMELRPIVKTNFYVQLQNYSDFLKTLHRKVAQRQNRCNSLVNRSSSMSTFETLQRKRAISKPKKAFSSVGVVGDDEIARTLSCVSSLPGYDTPKAKTKTMLL